jgi:hypothetical protein
MKKVNPKQLKEAQAILDILARRFYGRPHCAYTDIKYSILTHKGNICLDIFKEAYIEGRVAQFKLSHCFTIEDILLVENINIKRELVMLADRLLADIKTVQKELSE